MDQGARHWASLPSGSGVELVWVGWQVSLLLLLDEPAIYLLLKTDPIGEFPAVVRCDQIDAQAITGGQQQATSDPLRTLALGPVAQEENHWEQGEREGNDQVPVAEDNR